MHLDSNISLTDLGLVATLVALGYELKELDRSTPSRVRFVFSHKEGIEPTIESYWDGTLSVSASTLINTYKQLKGRLHAGV